MNGFFELLVAPRLRPVIVADAIGSVQIARLNAMQNHLAFVGFPSVPAPVEFVVQD